MKLNRLTERIWVYPYEEERDRPNLSYIRGDRWSMAVDAGHSAEHTQEFYRALEEAGLPLPEADCADPLALGSYLRDARCTRTVPCE